MSPVAVARGRRQRLRRTLKINFGFEVIDCWTLVHAPPSAFCLVFIVVE